MPAKKVIVVFGATGLQGGSVVKSILGDPEASSQFSIRAVTRDVSKPAANSLVDMGCEVVAADLDDKASLVAAMKGAYGAFVVTNFWEIMNLAVEIAQGKNAADAAKEAGIQQIVWSSLLPVSELSKRELTTVAHWDSKAQVETYMRSLELPGSYFLAGGYMFNALTQMIRKDPNSNTYMMKVPIPAETMLPLFDVAEDTGKFVKGIFLNREKTLDKRICGATAYYSLKEILETFKETFPEDGKDARYLRISEEQFKVDLGIVGMPPVAQEHLLGNMHVIQQYGYYWGESLDGNVSILKEPLTSWKEYLLRTQPETKLR